MKATTSEIYALKEIRWRIRNPASWHQETQLNTWIRDRPAYQKTDHQCCVHDVKMVLSATRQEEYAALLTARQHHDQEVLDRIISKLEKDITRYLHEGFQYLRKAVWLTRKQDMPSKLRNSRFNRLMTATDQLFTIREEQIAMQYRNRSEHLENLKKEQEKSKSDYYDSQQKQLSRHTRESENHTSHPDTADIIIVQEESDLQSKLLLRTYEATRDFYSALLAAEKALLSQAQDILIELSGMIGACVQNKRPFEPDIEKIIYTKLISFGKHVILYRQKTETAFRQRKFLENQAFEEEKTFLFKTEYV